MFYKTRKIKLDKKNIDVDSTVPIKCIINNKDYYGDSWQDLFLNICIDFKHSNDLLFGEYLKISSMFCKAPYFKNSYYDSNFELYITNLNNNGIYREMHKIIMIYDIDFKKCTLLYKK